MLPRARTLAAVEDLLADHPGLLVRYSAGPECDRTSTSTDYESGLELPGLSCNPLTVEPWWTRPVRDWIARKLCNYAHLQQGEPHRFGWLLVGHTVARGPDNEPLVARWELVALLDDAVLNEAQEWYAERFAAGHDSRG